MKTPDYYIGLKNDRRTTIFLPDELWKEVQILAIKRNLQPGTMVKQILAFFVTEEPSDAESHPD